MAFCPQPGVWAKGQPFNPLGALPRACSSNCEISGLVRRGRVPNLSRIGAAPINVYWN